MSKAIACLLLSAPVLMVTCSHSQESDLSPEDYVQYFFFEPNRKGAAPHFGDILVSGDGTIHYQLCEGRRLTFNLPTEEVSTVFSDLIRLGLLELQPTEGTRSYTGSPRPGYDVRLRGQKRIAYFRSEDGIPRQIRDRFITLFRKLDPAHWDQD
jgi:hypothetical protein